MLAHHVARPWTWAKRTAIKPLPYGQYHYDDDTVTCLAFRFTGCGGNSNNFLSLSECEDNCLPMDYNNCPANRPPVTSCNDERKCPEGSTCQRGYMISLCCDNKDIEKMEANYNPDCGGKKFVKVKSGEFHVGFFN
ncbi:unnamed protein product [Nippostrongylus brasiliensis]|uniref:BPTI/Kunitz inhibitor domain-containing protein n=1 Tax=Nippostrongylus brasiliensis TaxID=27835 RepID=A0A0N4XZQ5_NIPBR|nr:unnamed protein product [Nippostrongylus brasiliensis]